MRGYYAAGQAAETEFTEKKSRFITHARPVETAAEAEEFIAEIKRRYPDARHHCWAYRTHDPFGERYSDDGEPQGTAGSPMLGVLQKQEIEDICVVVVRYFGGILLGAAGLTRAYSRGCADGVNAAGKRYKCPAQVLSLRIPYDRLSAVERRLEHQTVQMIDKVYADHVTLTLAMPIGEIAEFKAALIELSGGKIGITDGEQKLCCFE
ncbi:MAG: YigZ family protein [Clostridia bacterium]|nr:YigZ family protein [Clostridia bacterium]